MLKRKKKVDLSARQCKLPFCKENRFIPFCFSSIMKWPVLSLDINPMKNLGNDDKRFVCCQH